MAETTTSNYPAALDNNTSLLGDQVNQKSLTLGEAHTNSVTTITMNATVSGVNYPGYILIDSEVIHYTAISGATLTTCTRGANGTSAATHANEATVYFVPVANWANQLKRAIVATETELGTDPAGSLQDVKTRLAVALNNDGSVKDNAITLAMMAGGTDGNIISYDASGDPVAIATGSDGEVLTSAGTGAPPAFEAAAGGGITYASIWTLTSSFTGTQAPINANLSETSTDGQGKIGTSMTESSGIFTFPATGVWWINFVIETNDNINSPYNEAMIVTTTDNSSYGTAAQSASYLVSGETRYTHATLNIMFDVTSTSTHKVRFHSAPEQSGVTTAGSSGANHTYMTFIRLGDT
jgi:hypothetical protein